MAARASQWQHDCMVRQAATHLQRRFYRKIRADLSGFPRPAPVAPAAPEEVATPDLTAEGRQSHVFEVETDDTILHPHTRQQWPLLAAHAARVGAQFWVVVPPGSRAKAEQRLQELELEARVWEA